MAENEGFSFEEDNAPSGKDDDLSLAREEMATDFGDDSPPQRKGARTRILLLLLLFVMVGAAGFYFYVLPASSPVPEAPQTTAAVNKKPIAIPPRPAVETRAAAEKPIEEKSVAEKKPAAKGAIATEPVAGEASVMTAAAVKEIQATEEVAANEKEAELAPVLAEANAAVPSAEEPKPAPAPRSNYTVAAGAFLLRSNVLAAEEKIQKSGFVPQVVEKKKMMEMTRLRVGIFPQEEGSRKLEELQELAPDAFYLPAEDGVALYAASFQNLDKARLFADRLFEQGVRVEEEIAQVEIPLYFLSIDGFASLDSAREAAGTVRDAGLEAMVVRNI